MAGGGTTATTRPLAYTATITGEHDISGAYRQGVARHGDAWIFTTNDGIYRTDEAFTRTSQAEPAIPAALGAQTYDHIGDGDVEGDVLWVPVEKADKDQGEQVLARYDAASLAFRDSFVVPQHHASFVAVGSDGTIYSTDEFSDSAIQRYRLAGASLERLTPLPMDRTVERIQGGDVADDALWLSTDDASNGVFRVDLQTGAVQEVGSLGHVDGEGEGIDAKLVPVRLVDLAVAPG